MCSKKTKFLIGTLSVVLTRIADLFITYIYTPTLMNELNPLVSIFAFD